MGIMISHYSFMLCAFSKIIVIGSPLEIRTCRAIGAKFENGVTYGFHLV